MSNSVKLEINPRHVLEAMADDDLAMHVVLATSTYYHRRVNVLGFDSEELRAFNRACNDFYAAVDRVSKAVKS